MQLDQRAIAPPQEKTESSATPGWMDFFFTRQIFAILLCFMLFMGGLMGYFSMVKEGEPEIKIARAMITTSWAVPTQKPLKIRLRTS